MSAAVEVFARGWRARRAKADDAPAIANAVADLLAELGATAPPAGQMQAAARALAEDPGLGVALLAELPDEAVAGLLLASFQTAVHSGGRYALIQDLWVHPSWRSRAIGAGLLAELREIATGSGIERIEVGLPRERFARTTGFYLGNGFEPVGPRMRALLA